MSDLHFEFVEEVETKKAEIELSPSPTKLRPDPNFSPGSSLQVDDAFKEDLN